jgi:hypothetical protein
MECLRVCPKDNIAINLRPWGSDLGPKTKHRLDETFLGLVMLACALIDSAVFLGPWGQLKSAAYSIGSEPWLVFAGSFLGIALGVLPGLYGLAVWAGQKLGGTKIALGQALARQGQALIPLGLLAWIAFTISFAFTKFSYVLPVLSDPFGWGWNLFRTAGTAWVGENTYFSLYLQVVILAVGLLWSSRVTLRVNAVGSSLKKSAPLILFNSLFTLSMLWLLIG